MLTLTLRNLERDGLVSRTVTPTIPPRVDYELTELGHRCEADHAARELGDSRMSRLSTPRRRGSTAKRDAQAEAA